MKWFLIIPLACILPILSGCNNHKAKDNSMESEKLRVAFQVIPEGDNSYSLLWTDTLGSSQNYTFTERPKEVWCIATNSKNDTLGYYMGRSTAQTYMEFNSADSVIFLNFMIGLNFFSNKWENDTEYKKETDNFPIHYKPVSIDLRSDLRKEIEIELEKDSILSSK